MANFSLWWMVAATSWLAVTMGAGKWDSSLQDELSYIVSYFREAGFQILQ